MSNVLLFATTSTDVAQVFALIWFGQILAAGAFISAFLIIKRRWYLLPQVPNTAAEPGAALLAGTFIASISLFLAAISLIANALGLSGEALQSPEGMRRMTLFTPAAQLATAGFVIALTWPYLPRLFHWTGKRLSYFRHAFAGYLLALPWVFLTGGLVQLLVYAFDLDAKKQHLLFEIWVGEEPGATLFKLVAVLSAVIAAPVAEELVFRGIAQRLVHRLTGNAVLSIVLASLAFTATHSPWTTQPSIFVLSLFLGWIYFRSGSILVPMLMHAIFNGLQFLLFLTLSGGESIPAPTP